MKFAVLRANTLGDFIFVLPALETLKAHFPHAELVYLGYPWNQEFLINRPSPIDRVIVIPPLDQQAKIPLPFQPAVVMP